MVARIGGGMVKPTSRVALHKSLFDVISFLPDLLPNFYRIFVLKQLSTFALGKVYGTIFRRTILVHLIRV